jgi:uncharacterized protein HemY
MLVAAGQHHQALFELLSALDLQPRRRSALELAAELYDEAGEGDQAATMRARLQALAPSPTAPR